MDSSGINAGARLLGNVLFSTNGILKKGEIELNVRVLADLAMNHP